MRSGKNWFCHLILTHISRIQVKERKYYKLFEAGDLHINNELRLVKVVNNYLIGDFNDPEIECLKILSDVSRGIPVILDYGSEEDITFLVTSYSRGTRLDSLIKNSTIDEDEVICWMLDICDILYTLHSHKPRIIHCNIKPSNIFIEKTKVELINFSAAYVDGYIRKGTEIVVNEERYRSPEIKTLLITGQAPTPSVDIYSLGRTMQDVLTGDDEIYGRKSKIKKISMGLDYILKKCTCIDPLKRYQNALELKKDLENINVIGIKAITENTQNRIKQLFSRKSNKITTPQSIPLAPVPYFRSDFEIGSENETTILNAPIENAVVETDTNVYKDDSEF